MNIGEEAKPPFAVLPDPSSLFLNRSKRLAALAPGHELDALSDVPRRPDARPARNRARPAAPPALPSFQSIGQALEHGMPPISRAPFEPDATALLTIDRLLDRLGQAPRAGRDGRRHPGSVASAPPEARRAMVAAALEDAAPMDDMAQRVLVAAALQVHFARLAAMLVADDLKPIADGVCPVCGSAPMTSSVVGWPKAHNTRFCACSLCGTQWNVVRVKCVLCSSTGGISYRIIEGKPDTVKAETCDNLPRLCEDPLPGQRPRCWSRSPTTWPRSASTC